MRAIIVFLAIGLVAILQPAAAQPKWAQGQTYSGNIDIGGIQVPLPAGEWVVTGTDQTTMTSSEASGQSNTGLAQIIDGRLRAYMSLSYNQRSMSNGWTVPAAKTCARTEIHHAVVVRDRQLDRSCLYVNHSVFAIAADSAHWWKSTVEYAKQNKISVPLAVIQSGVVVSDRANFISVAYYFNPEMQGFAPPKNTAWQTSDWNVLNVAKNKKKKAFIQSVIDWTEKSRSVVEAGLAGKLKKGEGLDWPTAMQ
jgi:hypothetical protein